MQCEYCDAKFMNKYSLVSHQKRAKYCLDIQRKMNKELDDKLVKCCYCSIVISDITRHKLTCKMKDKYLLEQANKQLEEYKLDIEMLKNETIRLREQVLVLSSNLQIYKDMHDRSQSCVEDIAKQPKITKTIKKIKNTNITMSPLIFTDEVINNAMINFNISHVSEGQQGVARFVHQYLLTDKDGNLNYICADPSRAMFNYADEKFIVNRDFKAKKLTNMLSTGIISKTKSMVGPIIEKDSTSKEAIIALDNMCDIINMTHNNSKFVKELIALTT